MAKFGADQIPTSQKADRNLVVLSLSGGGGAQGGGVSQGGTPGAGGGFVFPIRPEQFQLIEPARQSVTQTIGGAYQDHFGPGVAQITLSGHTGWRNVSGQGDGFEMFKQLRQIHRDYNRMCGEGDPASVTLQLAVNVPQGYGDFRVSSDIFRSQKSTQSPLLYRYEIQFTVLEITAAGGGLSSGQQGGTTNSVPFTADQIAQSRASLVSPLPQAESIAGSLTQLAAAPYVVRSGDSYESIAQAFYGDSTLSSGIQNANSGVSLATGLIISVPQVRI